MHKIVLKTWVMVDIDGRVHLHSQCVRLRVARAVPYLCAETWLSVRCGSCSGSRALRHHLPRDGACDSEDDTCRAWDVDV